MIATVIILSIILFISFYIIYNLLRKVEVLEEELLDTIDEVLNMKFKVNNAVTEMRQIDSTEVFESDDETGTIFKTLLEVVEELEDIDEN